MKYPFTVRVYGLMTDRDRLLVCDEYFRGRLLTKFPGGGLQFGEGPPQCLQREFMEELGLRINVGAHFYTTDFFQPSAFDPDVQVISIYYRVNSREEKIPETATEKFAFRERKDKMLSFRWIALDQLTENDLTFPIDRKAASLFIQSRASGLM
jgi:8-oxo-dGTP pyrophosphatase MutT (NUDIX family)